MKHARIVLLEEHRDHLNRLVFDRAGVEGAAFLLCGEARSDSYEKIISHAVVPIAEEDYLRREFDGLSISSQALSRITKLARYERLSIVFVHSHPEGVAHFSAQDDAEEERLIPFLQARIGNRLHGTLVVTSDAIRGRIYAPHRIPCDVLVVGNRLQLYTGETTRPVAIIFDRQVRAFGRDAQRILSNLHVGIVGVGGTGSLVAEQLYRLGVGRLTVFDGDRFDPTNVNRVYGSTLADVGVPKAEIAKRHLDRIGLGTPVVAIGEHITSEAIARELRSCDLVLGCTDKQIPRAILIQLALKYNLPVFDLGVLIDSDDGSIRGVHGRVTTLMPGEACLFCRGRISPEAMRIEALPLDERQRQIRDGYAPALDEVAPAVVTFTSAIASFAVSEVLHRLTGFMGSQRHSSELLIAFDQSRVRTNRVGPLEACMCADRAVWGRGDESPFLGMTWATRTT